MKQTLHDSEGRVIWTNEPAGRADRASGQVTGSGAKRFRTRLGSPDQEAKTAEQLADERAHLRAFRGFNSGRPRRKENL